ncbi:sensor histidine kinase [Nostocoides vanveenii]|uniref:histidine kinase n=1 Tax=Nostocoides vanveenii TaxID=330835 RepID=A0ABN2KYF5_9MICO
MFRTRRSPWLAAGYGLGHMLMAVPVALLMAFGSLAFGLSVLGVGLLLIRPWAPAVAAFARVNAAMAQSFLGREVPVPVLPRDEPGIWPQVRRWLGARAFWQYVLWFLFAASGGLILSALSAALPAGVIALVATAFGLWAGEGAPTWVSLLLIGIAVVLVPVWWILGDFFMRLRTETEAAILRPDPQAALERRVADLTTSRADAVDASAAEIRRIERDLHDGAQARLVALGMNLGMAADLLDRDPQLARQLLQEARQSTGTALGELRSVVRGIHPPVLADRGLIGAVQALALDLPIPVTVDAALPGRLPAPVESAAYFATAEFLANVVKHSGARNAWVVIAAPEGRLRLLVGDDGNGGADMGRGSGLAGIARRLAAFDGTMEMSSPVGGPTVITVEIPCEWLSPRTTSSSGTG